MDCSVNQQSVDHRTRFGVLSHRAEYLKLEDATEDDLHEKESLKNWRENWLKKEEQKKRETDEEQPEPKPGPKSQSHA
jgi:hypothetical protein